jgi:NADH:ubiquinone oxidoreductase subunit 2 (subunit N)
MSKLQKHTQSLVKIALALAFFASITLLGFIGLGESTFQWLQLDKLTHFLLFGLLTIVALQIASQNESSKTNQRIKWCLVLFGMNAVGVFAESIHLWVPYRSFELSDMISNLLGTNLLGIFHIGILSTRSKTLKNTRMPEPCPIQPPQNQSIKIRFRRNRHR